MKKSKIVVVVFAVALVFLTIGWGGASIWYWEQLQLRFDSEFFSNVGGPIVSLIGVVVYGITLVYLIRQNRILHSNSIKSHFEERYKSLLNNIDGFNHENPFAGGKLSFKEIPMYVMNQLEELHKGGSLKGVIEKFSEVKEPRSSDIWDALDASENNLSLRLMQITDLSDSPLNEYLRCLQRIKKFVLEVKESRLLDEEKINWEKRIYNDLLQEVLLFNYLNLFVPSMYYSGSLTPRIYSPEHYVEFTSFHDFRVFELYKWFDTNVAKDR